MKINNLILTLLMATLILGCSQKDAPTTQPTTAAVKATSTPVAYAYAEGSKKKGDKGLCVICVVDEGATEEEVAAETLDYEGKTYLFCNEAEKAGFISEPSKYAVK